MPLLDVELVHLDRDGVRKLLARERKRLLAHQLRHLYVERQICSLAAVEVGRALGKQVDQVAAERLDAVARSGR